MTSLLTLIVLLPLAGFLANGLFGNRLGNRFVSVVGCGLPLGHGLRASVDAGAGVYLDDIARGLCAHCHKGGCGHCRNGRACSRRLACATAKQNERKGTGY